MNDEQIKDFMQHIMKYSVSKGFTPVEIICSLFFIIPLLMIPLEAGEEKLDQLCTIMKKTYKDFIK